jgi:predicted permease
LFVGFLFSGFIRGHQHKLQFISLIGFQNSGYLPLALFAALFPKELLGPMLIYLFLFLLGFNFVTFSVGVYMLTFLKDKKFEWMSLFNPPVIATILSMILVFFRLNTFIPDFVFKPLNLIGECTLPLAMLVVGGNIAQIHLSHINKRAMCLVVLAKLIVLPLLGILFLLHVKLAPLISILIFIQLAMPPAANLSVIIRHYKKDDLLISQGLFFGHIFSILTLPLLLSLYFMFNMLR